MKGKHTFLHPQLGLCVMGGLSPLEERLSCNCQACLAWRRCGSLIGGFHGDAGQARRAAAILRHAVCELSDLIEIRHSGSVPPLAEGRPDLSVTPGGGVGTEEEKSRSRGRESRGAGHSSSHKGPSPNKERLASEKEGEKVSKSKKSKKRDRSRRRRSSPERSVKAPASPQPARSPRSFIPVKEEGESEGDGPSAPPGRWSLTEAPFSWSTSSPSRRAPGSSRPPEPPGPPPAWVSRAGGGVERKSKGIVRRERSKDINLFGFSDERKRQRESRRNA